MGRDAKLNESGDMEPKNRHDVLTIGHSTLPLETFLAILERAGVTAVADVRSSPFSRRLPYFSKDELRPALKANGIKYVFLGKELGGRPRASNLYCDGIANYEKMAQEPEFLKGLDRVMGGAREHTIVLMCSEHDPLDCHRCLLVGRALAEHDLSVGHILNNGRVAEQQEIEEKLLILSGGSSDDMFATREDRLAEAYRLRAKNVAYREPRPEMAHAKAPDRNDHGL